MTFNLILIGILVSLTAAQVAASETTWTEKQRRRLLQMPGVDILVLMDESGSMGTQQMAFKDNVEQLFTSMNEQMQGSRAALVGFGAVNTAAHSEQAHVHDRMTSSMQDFQTAANELVANGGLEPSCEALIKVLEATDNDLDVGLREYNKFCVVLITDEESNHDDPDYDEERAIEALTNNNVADSEGFFFGIMPQGPVANSFQPLVEAAGGFIFDKAAYLATPASVMEHLVTKCNVAVNQITMEPLSATLQAGQEHEITVKAIKEENQAAVAAGGERIVVKLISGPGAGAADVEVTTNAAGEAVYKYTSTTAGVNVFEACQGNVCAKKAQAEWTGTTPAPEGRAIGDKAIEVGPRRSTLSVGETHTLTVKVFLEGTGTGIKDENVWLKVICGPHKGENMNANTNASGEAVFKLTATAGGRDIYEACIFLDNNATLCGEIVTATFMDSPGVVLSPGTDTRNIGTTLGLTATLTLDSGSVGEKAIAFDILSGPHFGQGKIVDTNLLGKAPWSYTGIEEGTDTVEACYINECDEVSYEWQFPANVYLNPASAPSCIVGQPHVLRATVNRRMQGQVVPLVNKDVAFRVKSGPNAGMELPSNRTDETGDAFSQCTGNSTGTNVFEACIIDNGGVKICSTADAIWRAAPVAVPGLALTPEMATRNIGRTLSLTATLTLSSGTVGGKTIAFDILTGPHSGQSNDVTTTSQGMAPWSYTGTGEGTDTVEACYNDECKDGTYQWQFPANVYLHPASAPSCIVGDAHKLRATVNREILGTVVPLVNKNVTFQVISGPNAGMWLAPDKTDATGDAFSQCTGNSTGTNQFEACIIDNGGEKICSTAQAVWRASPVAVPGLTLSPGTATRNIGTTLNLTATLTLSSGSVGGKTIAFDILTGPHAGHSNDVPTDALGKAFWSYTATGEGTDRVEACYNNECEDGTYQWQFPANVYLNPASAPSCVVGQPHKLRATVNRQILGTVVPVVNKDVTFRVKSGPNAGMVLPLGKTDATGDAFSQCTGNSTGTNQFEACIIDNGGEKICSTAQAVWNAPPVAGPGLTLFPVKATQNIGTTLDITATLTSSSGTVGGKTIAFDILTGPHAGQSNDVLTNTFGKASWSYTATGEGTDKVEACYNDECKQGTYDWQFPANVYLNPLSAPACIVGQPHNLLATVNRLIQGKVVPIANKAVTFQVKSGPNAGMWLDPGKTNSVGDAFSQCTGNSTGTNVFEACIIDNGGEKICSTAQAVWNAPPATGPGLTLFPGTDTRNIGRTLSLTATLASSSGSVVGGKTIAFDILTGPHAGQSNDVTTSALGIAPWSYTGTGEGTDKVEACYNDECKDGTYVWQFRADVEVKPQNEFCVVGVPHKLQATISRRIFGVAMPIENKVVTFQIKSGPNAGTVLLAGKTNKAGDAFSVCTGNTIGTNVFEACIIDNGDKICSTGIAVWRAVSTVTTSTTTTTVPVTTTSTATTSGTETTTPATSTSTTTTTTGTETTTTTTTPATSTSTSTTTTPATSTSTTPGTSTSTTTTPGTSTSTTTTPGTSTSTTTTPGTSTSTTTTPGTSTSTTSTPGTSTSTTTTPGTSTSTTTTPGTSTSTTSTPGTSTSTTTTPGTSTSTTSTPGTSTSTTTDVPETSTSTTPDAPETSTSTTTDGPETSTSMTPDAPETSTSTTTTDAPETTTTDAPETTTNEPETTTDAPETTTTAEAPETTTSVAETTTDAPETTTTVTVPETTVTVPETTVTVPETTATVQETAVTVPETTVTVPEKMTETMVQGEITTTVSGIRNLEGSPRHLLRGLDGEEATEIPQQCEHPITVSQRHNDSIWGTDGCTE